jgi:hypothetical protein
MGMTNSPTKHSRKPDCGSKIGRACAFGPRLSLHEEWSQCSLESREECEKWSNNAADFIEVLGDDSSEQQIAVWATSSDGKISAFELLNAHEYDENIEKLNKLGPNRNNLFFDPLPYNEGTRTNLTQFSCITLQNKHPLDLLPQPVAFWKVGDDFIQALLPWYNKVFLSVAEARINALYKGLDIINISYLRHHPPRLPGTLIFDGSKHPKPVTMLYDGFSALYMFDRPEFHRHRY